MVDFEFFEQFIQKPIIDDNNRSIIPKIIQKLDICYRLYTEIATSRRIPAFILPFTRPLYLYTIYSANHFLVLFSNVNAVRNSTHWFNTIEISNISTLQPYFVNAQYVLGLDDWQYFTFPSSWLDYDDVKFKLNIRSLIEDEVVNHYENELLRRRIVQIKPVFKGRSFTIDNDLCFILMPFNPDIDIIYKDHVKKVVEKLGYKCERADDIYGNIAIMEDIWSSINEAKFIIADLTGRNPNVFYEVGLAHTIGKEVILITENSADVPFDLKHIRYIEYVNKPRGMKQFEKTLEATINTVV